MTTTCMRCSRIAPLSPKSATHHLWLCDACLLLPACGEYQHQYRGTGSGTWVCVQCGQTLGSQGISTQRVETPQTPSYDCGC